MDTNSRGRTYSTVVANDSYAWSTTDDEQEQQVFFDNSYSPLVQQNMYEPAVMASNPEQQQYQQYILPRPFQPSQDNSSLFETSPQLSGFGPLENDPHGAHYARYSYGYTAHPPDAFAVPSPPWVSHERSPPGWPSLPTVRMPQENNQASTPDNANLSLESISRSLEENANNGISPTQYSRVEITSPIQTGTPISTETRANASSGQNGATSHGRNNRRNNQRRRNKERSYQTNQRERANQTDGQSTRTREGNYTTTQSTNSRQRNNSFVTRERIDSSNYQNAGTRVRTNSSNNQITSTRERQNTSENHNTRELAVVPVYPNTVQEQARATTSNSSSLIEAGDASGEPNIHEGNITDITGTSNSLYEIVLKDKLKTVSLSMFEKDVEITRLKWAIESLKQESHNSYAKVVGMLSQIAVFFSESDEEISLDTRPPWFDVENSGSHKRKLRAKARVNNDVESEKNLCLSKMFSVDLSSDGEEYDGENEFSSDSEDEICVRPSVSVEDNTLQEGSDDEEVCERFGVRTVSENPKEEIISNTLKPTAKLVELERLSSMIIKRLKEPLLRKADLNIDRYGPHSGGPLTSKCDVSIGSDCEESDYKKGTLGAVFLDVHIQTDHHHGCSSCGRSFKSFDQIKDFSKYVQTFTKVSDSISQTCPPVKKSTKIQTFHPRTYSTKAQTIMIKKSAKYCQSFTETACNFVQVDILKMPDQIKSDSKMIQTEEDKDDFCINTFYSCDTDTHTMEILSMAPDVQRDSEAWITFKNPQRRYLWFIRIAVCVAISCAFYFGIDRNILSSVSVFCSLFLFNMIVNKKSLKNLKCKRHKGYDGLPNDDNISSDNDDFVDTSTDNNDSVDTVSIDNKDLNETTNDDNNEHTDDVESTLETDVNGGARNQSSLTWRDVARNASKLVLCGLSLTHSLGSWAVKSYFGRKEDKNCLPWCPYIPPHKENYRVEDRSKMILCNFTKNRNIEIKNMQHLNEDLKVDLLISSYEAHWIIKSVPVDDSEHADKMLKDLMALLGIQTVKSIDFMTHPDSRYFLYWLARARNENVFIQPPRFALNENKKIICEIQLYMGDFCGVARGESDYVSSTFVEELEKKAAERLFHNALLQWTIEHNSRKFY